MVWKVLDVSDSQNCDSYEKVAEARIWTMGSRRKSISFATGTLTSQLSYTLISYLSCRAKTLLQGIPHLFEAIAA